MASSPAGNPNHPHFLPQNPNPNFPPNPNPNYYSPPPHPHATYSYPPPTAPFQNPSFLPPNPNPNVGARLMALLGTGGGDHQAVLHPIPSAPPATTTGKMPRGRILPAGERAAYDVDFKLPGESLPPQLEVTPITRYASDPGLVLGRQIAVNRSYICYGLKLGAIRVLNINTALRSLLRGHSQRVTDMAFFAEDVHFLASASVDGRVFVWKINEGPDNQNVPQISGRVIVAIQMVGDEESYHPRICWHSHKQEVLFVAIGSYVLKIDTTRVGRGLVFSAEEPLMCPVDMPIDGVQCIGKHEGEVTDLSISQWMTSRLASASKDGTVKIWDDRRAALLAVLRPHEGLPVNSVAFLTSPDNPEHIILITGGPLNREVKIWTSTNDEGWLLPSESESWQSRQTLEFRSSTEMHPEEAFFNQVVVLPRASIILLANARKNAIYAVHVDYGNCPASTRMDYVADFTVTMPILSVTATSDSLPDGEQVVQVYCVQTQAIQQYALDLAQCLPSADAQLLRDYNNGASGVPHTEESSVEQSLRHNTGIHPGGRMTGFTVVPQSGSNPENVAAYPAVTVPTEVFPFSNVEARPSAPPLPTLSSDISYAVSSPGHLNMDVSSGISLLRNPSNGLDMRPSLDRDVVHAVVDYSAEGGANVTSTAPDSSSSFGNLAKDESQANLGDNHVVSDSHLKYRLGNTTHLVTPSEILSGAISSTESTLAVRDQKGDEVKVQEVVYQNEMRANVEEKLGDESCLNQHAQIDSRNELKVTNAEIITSEVNSVIPEENHSSAAGTFSGILAQTGDDLPVSDTSSYPSFVCEEAVQDHTTDVAEKATESSNTTKGKRQRSKRTQTSGPSPPTSLRDSIDFSNEPGSSTILPPNNILTSQIQSMQETLSQLVGMQKEMQKQMNGLATPINKEGKRLEAALGRSMEKSIKASFDSFWSNYQEESSNHEKAERERMQQLTNLITNFVNKDLPSTLEKVLKSTSVGSSLARSITPAIEKSISSAITECFQRGIGDKAVSQLDRSVTSKLEATITRQIQAQFQTSGKQALQEALRSSLESSVVPAFERSCKTMFEQVDVTFKKGMNEHTAAAKQQLESMHTPLAQTLRDAIASAQSVTQTLNSELADGQRKLVALVAENSKALNPMGQQSNGPITGFLGMPMSLQQVEAPLDPTQELSRLISEHKFGEAFTVALQRSDVSLVSWLCSQVDLHVICAMVPLPLNQGVLLALLQQLACDVGTDTSRKLGWMTDVAVAINPTDPMIVHHIRPIFEQVYNVLAHQRSLPTTTPNEGSSIRLIMHVINSVLLSCK